jgi:hypothetical protein
MQPSPIASYLKQAPFAGGFHQRTIDDGDLRKAQEQGTKTFEIWTAADARSAAVVTIFDQQGEYFLNVRFPISRSMTDEEIQRNARTVLTAAGIIGGGSITFDTRARVCLNYSRAFTKAEEVAPYLEQLFTHGQPQRDAATRFVAQELEVSTDLSREADLQTAAGKPIKLTPREMEALAGGVKWAYVASGLGYVALGVITVATEGAAVGVCFVGALAIRGAE